MKSQQSYGTPMESSKLISLFKTELKDFYQAEKAFTRVFPSLIKNAKSQDIIDQLNNHLAETENQIRSAEQFFESIDKK